jgi:hypothetical protein
VGIGPVGERVLDDLLVASIENGELFLPTAVPVRPG